MTILTHQGYTCRKTCVHLHPQKRNEERRELYDQCLRKKQAFLDSKKRKHRFERERDGSINQPVVRALMRPALRALKSLNTSSAARPSISSRGDLESSSGGENVLEMHEKETKKDRLFFVFPLFQGHSVFWIRWEKEREKENIYV